MRKMTVKQARKVRDALMIGGTIIVLLTYFWEPFVCVGVIVVEMSRNVQSGNTQNLKSSAAPVRLPAAPASTPGTSQAVAQAGCVYRP